MPGYECGLPTNQPPKANSAVHPSWVGKWVPASARKAKAGMVHSISGWTRGVQVKLWDPLRTCAIPECLRGVFTMLRRTNSRLPLPAMWFYVAKDIGEGKWGCWWQGLDGCSSASGAARGWTWCWAQTTGKVSTVVCCQFSIFVFVNNMPRVEPGHPSSPLSIYFLIFSPIFTFPFLSLALPIFFFCPSLLFLPE